jgi:putative alpha-1,2-mannosidase
VINAPKNNATNKYINTLNYNGKVYGNTWLSHSLLMQGAELNFDMSATPNKQRGIKAEDVPYSLSTDK